MGRLKTHEKTTETEIFHAAENPEAQDNFHAFYEEATGGSIIKVVLRNFAKFTGKQLCQTLFLNKVAGLITKKRDSGTGVFL